jgi:hypothetical protein
MPIDEANTSIALDDIDGMPIVASTNLLIVPAARAADIQRGLRAIIQLAGSVAAHELAHWLGASTTRANGSLIEVPPSTTVLAPHNQDAGGHNRVPSPSGLMDDGDSKSLRTMLGLNGASLVFNAEQRSYLSEVLPNE